MGGDAMIEALLALSQVLLIDLVLAGDNAVVVGMAAGGLSAAQRHRAILWGIGAAAKKRSLFGNPINYYLWFNRAKGVGGVRGQFSGGFRCVNDGSGLDRHFGCGCVSGG